MPKLNRYTARIFGSTATSGQIKKFGSLANGTPQNAADPSEVMSLTRWLSGWFSAVIGGNSPTIEDMNAVNYAQSYQTAYIMQQGICEYDAGTEYNIGSFVSVAGVIYRSIADLNTGNAVTDITKWVQYGGDFSEFIDGTASAPAANRSRLFSNEFGLISQRRNASTETMARANDLLALSAAQACGWSTLGTSLPARSWGAVCVGINSTFGTTYAALSSDNGAAAGSVHTSTDGLTWTTRTPPIIANWQTAVGFIKNDFTSPIFVAGGLSGGSTPKIITSTDGITWTERTVPAGLTGSLSNAITGNDDTFGAAVYLMVNALFRLIRSANDGVTWTEVVIPGVTAISGITFHRATTKFYLLANAYTGLGSSRIYESTNGLTWTLLGTNNLPTTGSYWFLSFVSNGTSFVATDITNNRIYHSTDLLNWRLSGPTSADRVLSAGNVFVMPNSSEASYDGRLWVRTGLSNNSSNHCYNMITRRIVGVSSNASDANRSFISLRI